MTGYRISWAMYIVGSLLVFGSWMNIVPTALGWCGWLVALAGWAVGNTQHRQFKSRSKAYELAALNQLRKDGVLTEDEFQVEKSQILKEQ